MAEDQALNVAPRVNPEAMKSLGVMLATKFSGYEADRRLAELKWVRNARQFLGIYDPEVESAIPKDRSRAYPKLTRVKVVSMLSRLMNLLFQTDDKCWGITASAVPNLAQEDLQTVLDKLTAEHTGEDLNDDAIEQAIREFAKKRAVSLELEVTDQLQELGGNAATSFMQLSRKVLYSGLLYGMGVAKGPFTEKQMQRTWKKDYTGRMMSVPVDTYRPRFEFVSIWDYYPDMSAKYLHQMEGQFERHVMSKHQLIMLKQRTDFIASQIDEVIRVNPSGNYKSKTYETELKDMGVQKQVQDGSRNKFEALSWEGYVSGKELAAAGVDVPESKLSEDVRANVWFMGNIVIKAELDPWSELDTDGEMPMYHQFVFEEDESTLLGNGLPNIMRDSQMNLCSAVRMAIDNGSIMRNLEVNTSLLSLNNDITAITPDKIWYREDDGPATINVPAIRVIDFPIRINELQAMATMFQGFADQETFVNPSTGGDMQKGPSEPFRTATGASMIQGAAGLPFKDVVRNFDRFVESVIGSIIVFNRNFNADPKMRGDFKPVARGATSLIAKEVLGIQLDNYATTLTDGEKPYVKFLELARARARVRDLFVEDIVVDDATAKKIDENTTAQQEAMAFAAKERHDAEVRQIRGDTVGSTLKALSQSSKNSASADATTAKILLDALEKGLPIDDIIRALTAGAQTGGAGTGENNTGESQGAGAGSLEQAAGAPVVPTQGQAAAMPVR